MKKSKILSAIMVLAVTVIAIVGCCRKEVVPPTPPTLEMPSIILGKAFQGNYENITGVTVSISFNGQLLYTYNTDNKGYIFDKLTQVGKYTLTFSKSGYHTSTAIVNITENTSKSATIYQEDMRMVRNGITVQGTPEKPFEIIIPDKDFEVSTSDKRLFFPVGCIASPAAITVTPIVHIHNEIDPINTLFVPIAVLDCKPDGQTFVKNVNFNVQSPVSANVSGFEKYRFENTVLTVWNSNTNKWQKLTDVASKTSHNVGKDSIMTNLTHFSSYKMGLEGAVIKRDIINRVVSLDNAKYDNFDGIRPLRVDFVTIPLGTGYEYIDLTPEVAVANAGLKGEDATAIATALYRMVALYYESLPLGTDTGTFDYPVNVEIPVGTKVLFQINDKIKYEDIQYTITDTETGMVYKPIVRVGYELATTISYNSLVKGHEGGGAQ